MTAPLDRPARGRTAGDAALPGADEDPRPVAGRRRCRPRPRNIDRGPVRVALPSRGGPGPARPASLPGTSTSVEASRPPSGPRTNLTGRHLGVGSPGPRAVRRDRHPRLETAVATYRTRAAATPSHAADCATAPARRGTRPTRPGRRAASPWPAKRQRRRTPTEPEPPRAGPNPGKWGRPRMRMTGSRPADARAPVAQVGPPRNSGGGDPGSSRAYLDRHRRPRTGRPVPRPRWEGRVPSSGSSYRQGKRHSDQLVRQVRDHCPSAGGPMGGSGADSPGLTVEQGDQIRMRRARTT